MARRKKAPPKEEPKENPWQEILNDLESGSGEFYFFSPGKHKIRLVLPEEAEDETEFYRDVVNSYGKTKYIMLGVPLDADEELIQPLVAPKTVLTGIIGILAEEYELFDPEEGHGINVTRSGQGQFDTTYSVVASPKPVALEDDIVWPEQTLDEFAADFEAEADRRSDARNGDDYEEEEPEEKPTRRRRKRK